MERRRQRVNRTGIRESGCSLMDSGNLYRMEDIWRKIWKRGCCQSRLDRGWWRGCSGYGLYGWERRGIDGVRERCEISIRLVVAGWIPCSCPDY